MAKIQDPGLKHYPDITDLLGAKIARRRRLAALPILEKLKILERLRAARDEIKLKATPVDRTETRG